MNVCIRSCKGTIASRILYIRPCSTNSFEECSVNELGPRPFKDIPGPKALPLIGTTYKYFPFFGEYSFTRLHETGAKKLKKYGPLVREQMVPGVNLVWVFRPEDIAEMFKAEAGLNPDRRSHLALLKYRNDRSHVYNSGGLLPTNGPEWWRIRREFQKVLSKPRNVVGYLPDTDCVIKEFVDLCCKEKFNDFSSILSRLFLELTCLIAFDVRIHSFSNKERLPNSMSTKLINAAYSTNSAILKLDNGLRLWRFFETPLYRKMQKAQTYMEEVALEMVSRKMVENRSNGNKGLVYQYLENPALDVKDVIGMACDMLLAGIDTTTYSTAFALYHLSRNEEVQNKLRNEARQLLVHPEDPITADTLKNACYTKAVIKETFRMNPISVGIGRILQNDTVLSGYLVPKGTVAVTQNQVICRLPEYFNDPDTFFPERWLRDGTKQDDKSSARHIHPYLLLPFGHGPRSCIARRFAEQNMQAFLLQMSRQMRFSWSSGELGSTSLLINKPDAPLTFDFHKTST